MARREHTLFCDGPETCALSERAHCEVALDELSRFHWTFLNGDYHPDVIGRFQSEGCWGEIVESLGYRFVLDRLEHSVAASTGGFLRIAVTGRNQGFATPIHQRAVELVLSGLDRRSTVDGISRGRSTYMGVRLQFYGGPWLAIRHAGWLIPTCIAVS